MGHVARLSAPGRHFARGQEQPRLTTTAAQWGQTPLSMGHPAATKQLQWRDKGPALRAAMWDTAERCISARDMAVPAHGSHLKSAACERRVKGSGTQMSGIGDSQTLCGGCTTSWVSWCNPSGWLSPTQPLAHSP